MLFSRDHTCGIVLLGTSICFGMVAAGYPLGTLLRMGPGFFPLAASVILGLLSIALLFTAERTRDRLKESPEGRVNLKPFAAYMRAVVAVLASILAFALTLEPLGLVPATVLLVLISSLAIDPFRLMRVLTLTAVLSAAAVLIFVKGLGLPIAILEWPL